jgi:hypothetical protein
MSQPVDGRVLAVDLDIHRVLEPSSASGALNVSPLSMTEPQAWAARNNPVSITIARSKTITAAVRDGESDSHGTSTSVDSLVRARMACSVG